MKNLNTKNINMFQQNKENIPTVQNNEYEYFEQIPLFNFENFTIPFWGFVQKEEI